MFLDVSMNMYEISFSWGQINSLVKRYVCKTGCRRKLSTVPSHSCYIHATCHMGTGTDFYWVELSPLSILLTIFSLAIACLLIDDVNYYMHLLLTCNYSLRLQNVFSISLKNLQDLLKALANSFATHTQ